MPIIILACISIAYFIVVKGLLVDLPVAIGEGFISDTQRAREKTARKDERATALIVRCIHRKGIAKFGPLDEYKGCDPLPLVSLSRNSK